MTYLLILLIIAFLAIKAIGYKISGMAVFMYYIESGAEPPTEKEIEKYTKKAIKRIFRTGGEK